MSLWQPVLKSVQMVRGNAAVDRSTFNPSLVTGVILAGGQSRRLGKEQPKALISLGGKMLLARVADVLKPLCKEIVLVVRIGQDDDVPDLGIALGMHVIEDDPTTTGPIAALHSGLSACTTPIAFVTGADHPFLSTALILEMLRNSHIPSEAGCPSFAAVAIRYRGHLNPLHAVYPTREWLRIAKETVARGESSLVALLDIALEDDAGLQVRIMTEDDVNAADPQHLSLFDIDTLEDLGIARRIVDRRSFKVRPDLRKGGT